jgi:NADPH:quinone reductase-like Zn-dependent oxidoreductase
MKAVRFERYGDAGVLEVRSVPRPSPGPGQVLVQVKAAGINPGEATIRTGGVHDRWPATFPSGQGSDLAGVVVETAADVTTFRPGDEVLGFTHERASHAEFAVVPAGQIVPKPSGVSWEAAGSLFVAGTTAYAAVRAIGLSAGDVVAVSAAAGGVGSIGVQLARKAGATVIGIAGPANDEWLTAQKVIPVNYGDGLTTRLQAAAPDNRVDAFLDFFGNGYVELAVTELGVPPQKVNTIKDFAAVEKFGVRSAGNLDADDAGVLTMLATQVAAGELIIPIARTFPLEEVRDAYLTLEQRHTRGKIVLRP